MENKQLLSRRQFMQLLTVAISSYPLSSLAINRNLKNNLLSSEIEEPWRTLSAVQEHLFPSEEGSLGANNINALGYLKNVINRADFEQEENVFIKNGVTWLNDLAKQQYSKRFIQLTNDEKEKILRKIEGSNAGSNWLSLILTYLLQALLTDPVYGGNPKGIGWEWLRHKPGFPRPPEGKKYFKLNPKRYRKTKA